MAGADPRLVSARHRADGDRATAERGERTDEVRPQSDMDAEQAIRDAQDPSGVLKVRSPAEVNVYNRAEAYKLPTRCGTMIARTHRSRVAE